MGIYSDEKKLIQTEDLHFELCVENDALKKEIAALKQEVAALRAMRNAVEMAVFVASREAA